MIYYTELGGPVLQILRVTTGEVLKQGNDQLKKRGINPLEIQEKITEKARAFLIYEEPVKEAKTN